MSRQILIVEDESLVAYRVEQDLKRTGFDVVGVAATVEDALDAVQSKPIDAVVLDGNLFDKSSEPVADLCRKKSIPFIILTGYPSKQLGDWIRGAKRLDKPHITSELVASLNMAMGAPP